MGLILSETIENFLAKNCFINESTKMIQHFYQSKLFDIDYYLTESDPDKKEELSPDTLYIKEKMVMKVLIPDDCYNNGNITEINISVKEFPKDKGPIPGDLVFFHDITYPSNLKIGECKKFYTVISSSRKNGLFYIKLEWFQMLTPSL